MRTLLAALLLLAGCATTPAPVLSTVLAEPPAPPPPTCPKTLGKVLDSGPVLGLKVEKVCLVGASEDGYLRLHELVAPREGSLLTLEAVRADVEALYHPGTLEDVVVVAEVLPSKNVMLSYVVTEAPWISKVEVTGATEGRAEQFQQLASAGLHATPFAMHAITEQVRALLEGLGFAKARVATSTRPLEAGKVALHLDLEEGPRTVIGSISFDGRKKVPEAELRKVLTSTVGAPFREEDAERDVVFLNGVYLDRGYVMAKLEHEELPGEKDTVRLIFKVTEGEQYRLGTLSVSGFAIGDEKEVLKGLESKPKSVFSRTMLKRDIDRLKERARQRGNVVNVLPVTDVNEEKKTVNVKFELERTTSPSSITF